MTARNLEFLFRPRSVAVIAEPGEPGYYPELVHRNLIAGGFSGRIINIDVRKSGLFGIPRRPSIGELTEVPDLAFTCTPLEDVPRLITQLGERGTRAVIVGPTRVRQSHDLARLRRAIQDAARPTLMRILGPGSGGLMIPALGLNASVAPLGAKPGRIALVTQSAAIASAVIDRAATQGIGFSAVVHLGNSIDVDLPDILDWLATDPATDAILVQFEHVINARKFMSAARAAARNKPVVAIRSGRTETTTPAAGTCSRDQIYDAAIRRAGWIRIDTLEGLFEATEALARARRPRGHRLTVLANGAGLGRIAADALNLAGGELASLGRDTLGDLQRLLHPNAALSNPLVLPSDTAPENWEHALRRVLADPATGAVLTVYAPTAFRDSADVARAICGVAASTAHNVLTCWLGGDSVEEARRISAADSVLSFDAPEKATAVFQRIVAYTRNRDLLDQMPPSRATGFEPDEKSAREAVNESMALGEERMPARLARRVLHAYRIPAREQALASSIEAATEAANQIGYPIDLELALVGSDSRDLTVRSLRSASELRIAARGLRSRARTDHPSARIAGYRLRPGSPRSSLPPLRLGLGEDPVFGPVLYLGLSAALPHHAGNCAVALPPLNLELARDLVQRTGLLDDAATAERDGLRDVVAEAMVGLSQLLTDIDEVAAVELDPLHVEADGVMALEFEIRLRHRERHHGYRRFAIHPYPRELEQELTWDGRRLLVRPIRPEDETTLADLISSLKVDDARMRFFGAMRQLPRSQLARFTQIDYDREMALVAIERDADGHETSLGEVRIVADPDHHAADFAIVVRSDCKGRGLGRLLMTHIIDYARARGIGEIRGETFADNERMQQLGQKLGFALKPAAEAGTVDLRLDLKRPSA